MYVFRFKSSSLVNYKHTKITLNIEFNSKHKQLKRIFPRKVYTILTLCRRHNPYYAGCQFATMTTSEQATFSTPPSFRAPSPLTNFTPAVLFFLYVTANVPIWCRSPRSNPEYECASLGVTMTRAHVSQTTPTPLSRH